MFRHKNFQYPSKVRNNPDKLVILPGYKVNGHREAGIVHTARIYKFLDSNE